MKNTMNNHPVQLFLEIGTIFDSILSDSIDTDKKVAGKFVTFAVIESDYISKVIMLEIFLIDIQNIIIRTEYD